MNSSQSLRVFYILIISQFCGTSLWFAGNAILPQLIELYQWKADSLGYLTSAVQLGFIIGTLSIALTGITDRFSPTHIFFVSSLAGALGNAIYLFEVSSLSIVLTSRFVTGFFLAGIYPVGMKIAADWREHGLGNWLGALVGALTIGTSFPHVIKLMPGFADPEALTIGVSALAALGGVLVLLFIKDGPFRKPALRFSFSDVKQVYRQSSFKAAAFGYFGHMWELYAFWAFVPWTLAAYQSISGSQLNIPLWSFIVIAAGFFGCALGGQLSFRFGSKRIATVALLFSGICCILSPMIYALPMEVFLVIVVFWGLMVVADSPQFSALVAFHAPPQVRGSAITITTCIGFTITIFSIQLLNYLQSLVNPIYLLLVLSPGPILGLTYLYSRNKELPK